MHSLPSIASWEIWGGFLAFIFLMITLDVVVFGGNKAHRVPVKSVELERGVDKSSALIQCCLVVLCGLLSW